MQRAKKSFGQNWLVDASVVGKIVEAAQIQEGEQVVEIGPGTGNLTQALVDAGAKVFAIEADRELIPLLEDRFGNGIELVFADALSNNYKLPSTSYKLIANIPYNITSDLIRLFVTRDDAPSMLLLMVQREVADRIVARAGEMSLLSVMCQLYADCSKVVNVPAGAFRPVPKVDSAVVKLVMKESDGDIERVIALAKRGFASRRKQLHKNLSSHPDVRSDQVKDVLESMGLDARVRAQELDVTQWRELTHKLFS